MEFISVTFRRSILISSMLMCGFQWTTAQQLDESELIEQQVIDQNLNENLVQELKKEVSQSAEVQIQNQQYLAQTQAEEFNQKQLVSNAVSDFELSKKADPEQISKTIKPLTYYPYDTLPRTVYVSTDPTIIVTKEYSPSKNLRK